MKLYSEERLNLNSDLIPKEMPNIHEAVEGILEMPDFSLWSVSPRNDLSMLPAIRNRQIGGNTNMVPGFKPYISDPEKWGGCIVETTRVLYCPEAIPLHQNRDSFTMIHGDGKNFYTTMTFPQLLRTILENGRTLHFASFDFASTENVKIGDRMDPALLV